LYMFILPLFFKQNFVELHSIDTIQECDGQTDRRADRHRSDYTSACIARYVVLRW